MFVDIIRNLDNFNGIGICLEILNFMIGKFRKDICKCKLKKVYLLKGCDVELFFIDFDFGCYGEVFIYWCRGY